LDSSGPGFFELLGRAPVAGRAFVPDDFTDRATAVVIGYGLWQQRFGGDPRTVGRTIQVDGASAATISAMVLVSGLSLGVVGLGIGLMGSMAFSRVVASFLYETSPFDPLTYLAVTILLFVVTTAATLTPTRRAARIDPMAALRDR
jgi:predicted lysophospholipase L1 biosynthesis ABC-type transport system permease subunit